MRAPGSIVLAILLCLLASSGAWAVPGLEISTRVEQSVDPLPFGKPATLILDLSWDEKWPFQPPEADTLEVQGFTVIDRFSTNEVATVPGRRSLSYHLVFTRFEPGEAKIPPIVFDTPSGQVKSRALEMTYVGAQAKDGDQPDQLRGPKDVEQLSTRDFWQEFAKYLALALLVLGLLVAIVRKLGLTDRWLSPRGRSLRRLDRLSKALNQQRTPPDEAILEMVEISRVYLHKAYGLITREATSREIARQLTMDNRCQAIKPVVKTVLERGDACKFAQRAASEGEVQDLLEQLRTALTAERRKPS